jgi:hypothetical protein
MRGALRRSGTYPASSRWTTQSPWDLLPNGHKAKGVTIFDRNWYGVAPETYVPTHLADFWNTWEWSAAGAFGAAGNWIKPQIDLAISIGCNFIRFCGTVIGRDANAGYTSGSGGGIIPDAQYFPQWAQVLQYCRSNGIYCQPTFEIDTSPSTSGRASYSTTNAWRVPEWKRLLQLFQAYLDVVMCVDLLNEGYGWCSSTSDTSYGNPGGNTYNSVIIYDALKPTAGVIPLTVSTYFKATPNLSNPWVSNSGGQRLPTSGVFDYYDTHLYYDPVSPAEYDGLFQSGLPVLMGEFGQNMSVGTPDRQLRYNSALAMAERSSNVPPPAYLTTAATGGTVLAGTYQVEITYVTAAGETVGSFAQSIVTTGSTSTIVIQSPPAVSGATGWYAYVTQAAGSTFTRQQTAGSPTAISTNLTVTAPPSSSGANPPGSDTSGLAARHMAGASAWCMVDHDTQTNDEWGIADASGNLRSDVTSIFESLPS